MRANTDRAPGVVLVTDPGPPVADVIVLNHGSILTFNPVTAKAKGWIEEHVEEDAQYLGSALAVEARYAGDLIDGMFDAGLKLR